jgi:DNA-binding transcriptional regulator YiaG
MPTEDELFAAVDALLAGEPELPPPAERARLREAAGITQARLATALQSTLKTVKNWEAGRSEPRPPRREAYLRLLDGWAERYPAPEPEPEIPPTFAAAPQTPAVPAPAEDTAAATTAPTRPPSTSRRPARKTAPAPVTTAAGGKYANGPLLVLDGDGTAYGVGGVMLNCPATTVPELVEWTLSDAGIGAERLHRHGRDSDPLVVLTESAAVRLGLPARLEGAEARRSLRLPDDHPAVKQVAKAKWKLTKRGFGPWARIYRPAQGNQRTCVQLAMLSWDALDTRAWGGAGESAAPEVARVLGTYAERVLTPRGSTAVCGLELMSALRPPTRATKDEATGTWVSATNAGALTTPVDPAPPEAPTEHPVAQGWERGWLDEEAYQWVRDPQLLDDAECLLEFAVGIDINTAFLAAASRLAVGLSAPVHVVAPAFDKKVPGCWLVDLSGIEIDPRLPSPFTPNGERPTGPAWYATPTVAYAEELGARIRPLEAFVRHETGAYLDPWHDRLKQAYLATMADLGVPIPRDSKDVVDERAFLKAMEHHKEVDPGMAAVLSAIKATVKGGIGKLRERPQGRHYREGERWGALERPTWSPHIRAMVISKARVNMHRKLAKTAALNGRYPLAVLSDCAVYASPKPTPLGFLPLTGADHQLGAGHVVPGSFRLGATPGLAKLEGVQPLLTAIDQMEQGLNPARHIKGGDAVLDEGE